MLSSWMLIGECRIPLQKSIITWKFYIITKITAQTLWKIHYVCQVLYLNIIFRYIWVIGPIREYMSRMPPFFYFSSFLKYLRNF
ncbi:hypothetical protein FKM82_023748 [Ascaphus truei]